MKKNINNRIDLIILLSVQSKKVYLYLFAENKKKMKSMRN